MNQVLIQPETSEEAIEFLTKNVTEEQWCFIEESLIMSKFKADIHLEKDLFDALDWPLDRLSYLSYLDTFQKWIPQQSNNKVWRKPETLHSQEVYDRICHFYYLTDQQTGIGTLTESIDWFKDFLVYFADNWGYFLSSSESFNDDVLLSYLKDSPQYRIQDSILNGRPNSLWNSFNDFFARELNPGLRPIDTPNDNNLITAPADSTFKGKYPIDANSNIEKITIKQTHSFDNINDLLKESKYADSFKNGTMVHYSLGPYAYHRFHSPVCGLVKESYPVFELTYLDVNISENGQFNTTHNSIHGQQFSQSRGILTLDTRNSPNGDMGIVAVIPIGMCQISSVHMLATPDTVLDKGEEFGYFKFGGSDIILLFQEGKSPNIDQSQEYRHYGNSISICPPRHNSYSMKS
jgi:phosphatidylserine decarboxylase precursor